jgi:hypothetical protein
MDYLYKKPKKMQNEIIVPIVEHATIITHEIPKSEPEVKSGKGSVEPHPQGTHHGEAVKQLGHITFISQEEYLRDIETMCQRDKWFMETVKGFCNKVVDVEQPIQSDKSTSVSGEGSE